MQPSQNSSDKIWRTTALTMVIVTCLYISTAQLAGIDFWLQAKIGAMIVANGAIPGTLLFPFTEVAEQSFNAHEWLASVMFHLVMSAIGESGMAFFTGALGLVYFALAHRLAYIRGGSNYAIGLLGGIAAIATENYRHTLRPELLSLILTAAYWITLENFRRAPSVLRGAIAASIVVLWVNTHGSFILAPIMAAIYAAGTYLDSVRASKSLRVRVPASAFAFGILTCVVLLACLINPFGWELISFVIGFSHTENLSNVVIEWMPTLSLMWRKQPGFWLAVFVWFFSAGIVLFNAKKMSAIDAMMFLLFSMLAIKAIRFPIYLGLLCAFICPPYISYAWASPLRQKRLYQVALAIAAITLPLAFHFGNAYGHHPGSAGRLKFSDQLVATLASPSLKGNVLTSMEVGAELIYRAYPRLRPSNDCRVDSYGLDYLAFQEKVLSNDALLAEFVARYDVRYILFDVTRFEVFKGLVSWKSKEWEILSLDAEVVFLKHVGVGPQ